MHAQYAHPHDKSKIDYVRLVNDLEGVPSFHSAVPPPRPLNPPQPPARLADTASLPHTSSASPFSSSTLSSSYSSPSSYSLASFTLLRLRATTDRSRLDISAALKAHDKTHNGTCSIPKFGSALTSVS